MESKKETDKLLSDLKKAGWGRKEIEEEFGYTPNYIAQALSRGGNPKLLQNLQKLLKRVKAEGGFEEYDLGIAIKKIAATTDVMLSAVAELLASATGQTSKVWRGKLEKMVNDKLNSSESEQ